MAKQNEPGAPGQTGTSTLSTPETESGLRTVLEWGQLTGNITTVPRRVNFGGPAGGQMQRLSIAHRVAAQLHGWTAASQCTRDAYEKALEAAMPEKLTPIPPQAPKAGRHPNPAKRRALAKEASAQASAHASRRLYQPHPAACAVRSEVTK